MASFNFKREITGDKALFKFFQFEMINYIQNLTQYWKDKIIFYLDENTKDIICHVKVDENYSKNSEMIQLLKIIIKMVILLQYHLSKVVQIFYIVIKSTTTINRFILNKYRLN